MTTTKARKASPVPTAAHSSHGNGNGQPPVFDLSSRYMAETVDIDIVDPVDGKSPTGLVWTIGSQFSKEARAAAMTAQRIRITPNGEVEAESLGGLNDTILDQLVAVTAGWQNLTVNGEPLPCTPENARALLTDPRTAWIRPQVQAAYLSLSRFFDSAKPN